MDRLEAKRDYKQTKRPMGVYRIRNMRNGKSYVGFSTDLKAIINRHKAELNFGSHRNKELLGEWKLFGEPSFKFEVLDELEFNENSKTNLVEELHTLHEMWVRRIQKAGDSVINL